MDKRKAYRERERCFEEARRQSIKENMHVRYTRKGLQPRSATASLLIKHVFHPGHTSLTQVTNK